MNKLPPYFYLIAAILVSAGCSRVPSALAVVTETEAINKVLSEQEKAWNNGNLEGYMQGYWQSDSLSFIGKSGITYGWQQTLNNYKKSYPDAAAMGKLSFIILKTELVGPKNAYVTGKWHLKREAGDLHGYFSLLWKKTGNRWVIVSDHSS